MVSSLNSYIKSFYENSTSIFLETQYDLQCISVEIVENDKTEILTKIRLKRKCVYHKSYYEKNKKQKVNFKKQYYIERKEQYKAYYMKNNNEIRKKQNQYKIDMKDVLSEKNSLYYQENIDFIREKQSQYYLENSGTVQNRMSEYKMQNKFQIRKVHQDYYKDNVDTFKEKNKVYYVRNRPKVREAHKNYCNYSNSKTSEITAGNNNVKTYTKKSLSRSESFERTELFQKLCRVGATFICVICNRCAEKCKKF